MSANDQTEVGGDIQTLGEWEKRQRQECFKRNMFQPFFKLKNEKLFEQSFDLLTPVQATSATDDRSFKGWIEIMREYVTYRMFHKLAHLKYRISRHLDSSEHRLF